MEPTATAETDPGELDAYIEVVPAGFEGVATVVPDEAADIQEWLPDCEPPGGQSAVKYIRQSDLVAERSLAAEPVTAAAPAVD